MSILRLSTLTTDRRLSRSQRRGLDRWPFFAFNGFGLSQPRSGSARSCKPPSKKDSEVVIPCLGDCPSPEESWRKATKCQVLRTRRPTGLDVATLATVVPSVKRERAVP